MVSKYSEDALVEQPAMQLLADLGWETLSGFDEHPASGGPIGRSSFTEAILEDRLRRSLRVVAGPTSAVPPTLLYGHADSVQ